MMSAPSARAAPLRCTVAGSGPSLVMLHPIAMRLEFWRKVTDELTASFRVLSCDLRGFGGNSRTSTPFTLDDLAQDVIELVRAEGIGPAIFVGCSLGGMVAQGVAVRAPGLAAGLVLSNTTHRISPEGKAVMRSRAHQARDNLRSAAEADIQRWFAPEFRISHRDEVDEVRQWALANDPEVVALAWEAIAGLGYGDRLRAFSSPVLAITGSRDAASPPATAQAICGAFPNARYHELDGAGHFAPIERPARFAALVRDFARSP